jgi:peptidyl-prolyl cis-trans isomerase SurA
MKKILSIIVFFYSAFSITAQNNDPVLFTVAGKPVQVSEFKYIYSKTNGEKADFSKASLEEYLDLYIKFKRKVSRARQMQLDTIPSLQSELAGYRQQLANSYLVDKEVSENLVKEAHTRMQSDIEIAHILVKLDKTALGKDTVEAFNKAMAIKDRLDKGEFFENIARELSDDATAKDNGGKLGYITAMLPNGFYELENAVYNTPVGKTSLPVRSELGFHLIKVLNKRPARGEVEVSHLLIRASKPEDNDRAKVKIDSIYKEIETGADFNSMVRALSEDNATKTRDGYIGSFGIGRYEASFEEAAFALPNDGSISKPFKTSVGWHILKRISRKPIPTFDAEKRRLKAKIQKDSRSEVANKALVNRIKREAGYKDNAAVLEKYISMQGDTFVTYKWRAPKEKSNEVLFSFNNGKNFTVGDFNDFINNNSRKRLSYQDNPNIPEAVKTLYADFVRDACIRYEEAQLEVKHPEFKSLMREYEEGILLFEAMKREVWDKASQDSIGLYNFHQTQPDKYKWDTRAEVSYYSLKLENKDKIEDLRALAAKKTYDKVLKKMNKKGEIVTVEPFKFEKGKNKILDDIAPWEVGKLTVAEEDPRASTLTFMKIEKIIPPTIKTLAEARGYVVADYQEFLEKKWLSDLEKNFEVKVDKAVLDTLIKK